MRDGGGRECGSEEIVRVSFDGGGKEGGSEDVVRVNFDGGGREGSEEIARVIFGGEGKSLSKREGPYIDVFHVVLLCC